MRKVLACGQVFRVAPTMSGDVPNLASILPTVAVSILPHEAACSTVIVVPVPSYCIRRRNQVRLKNSSSGGSSNSCRAGLIALI